MYETLDWILLPEDRDEWWVLVNNVMASGVVQMAENSLEQLDSH